jgi:hypothetical protein
VGGFGHRGDDNQTTGTEQSAIFAYLTRGYGLIQRLQAGTGRSQLVIHSW